jgi:DNA-binding NarL/FixJ family response regulator
LTYRHLTQTRQVTFERRLGSIPGGAVRRLGVGPHMGRSQPRRVAGPTNGLRVIVADDAVILREGLARLLAERGFDIVGRVAVTDELPDLAGEARPDVVILATRVRSGEEGLRVIKALRERAPGTGLLVLCRRVRAAYAAELIDRGAGGVGYLLEERLGDVGELAAGVRRIANGESLLDPSLVDRLARRPRDRDTLLEHLTDREREVLALMAEGRSNRAIAQRLFLSEHTIEKHIKSILGSLRLRPSPDDHRRVLAVLAFLDAR